MGLGAKEVIRVRSSLVLFIITLMGGSDALAGAENPGAARNEGIAVAIVVDTSGSMQAQVRGAGGKLEPKYVIASRALNAVIDRLEKFAATTEGGKARALHAGLVTFRGSTAVEAIRLGPFKAAAFRDWAKNAGVPNDSTPLGEAVQLAGQGVLRAAMPSKHVLVITDGINTAGPDPTATMPGVMREAERQGKAVLFHFIAFDIDAKLFDGLKKIGATVVGAADEKQLNSQFEFILEEKILLEAEDPAKKRKKQP